MISVGVYMIHIILYSMILPVHCILMYSIILFVYDMICSIVNTAEGSCV